MARVVGVDFGLLTSEDVDKAAVVTLDPALANSRKHLPVPGSCSDPRLGTMSPNYLCSECGNNVEHCPGHVGRIALRCPVFSANFPYVAKILTCICVRCSALLIPWTHPTVQQLRHSKAPVSFKTRVNQLGQISLRYRVCVAKRPTVNTPVPSTTEDVVTQGWCGAVQPACFVREGLLVRPIFFTQDGVGSSDTTFAGLQSVTAAAKYEHCSPPVQINMWHMFHMLQNASAETTALFGFHPSKSPLSAMMFSSLIVPPLIVRPLRSRASEDDLTMGLRLILKANSASADLYQGDLSVVLDLETRSRVSPPPMSSHLVKNKVSLVCRSLEQVYELQRRVDAYQGGKPVRLDSEYGRDYTSIRSRFRASTNKRDFMRGNMLGKRGDFTARCVASPDTHMQPDEVGIPECVLKKLTFPEHVTTFNYAKLLEMVLRGADRYPGANYIERRGQKFMVDVVQDGLQLGDIVHRHLQKGDVVIVNRQPTLHRFSLMAYRVRPTKALSTIQLHLAVTKPKNLDFDGDEVNVYGLCSYESVAEACELMCVDRNLFKDGCLLIGFVQHAVLGAYKLTGDDVRLDRRQTLSLLFEGNDEELFDDCRDRLDHHSEWYSGRFVMHALLPLYSATSTERLTKSKLNTLTAVWLRKMDSRRAVAVIGFITRVLEHYATLVGVSLSLYDCLVALPDSQQICIDDMRAKAEQQRRSLSILSTRTAKDKVTTEDNIVMLLDHGRDVIGAFVLRVLSARPGSSGLLDVTLSGSKGNLTHITQNVGMVGQQLNRLAQRNHRSTSHIYRDDCDRLGFVASSFVDGLTSTEFFHHLCSSRVGLVAPAVSTAETGYVFRKMCKSLEDLRICFDSSVRTPSGELVLARFGFNTDHLSVQPIRFVHWSVAETIAFYNAGDADTDGIVEEVRRLLTLRRLLLNLKEPPVTAMLPVTLNSWEADKGQDGEVVTCAMARRGIAYCWHRLSSTEFRVPDEPSVQGCFFDWLSSVSLRAKGFLRSTVVFRALIERLLMEFGSSVLSSGTPVGLITAQTFTQPLTQLNLNTFHVSGEKTELVGGVARIKEILNMVKQSRTPSMRIFTRTPLDPLTLVELTLLQVVDSWQDTVPGSEIVAATDHVQLVLILRKDVMTVRRISPRLLAIFFQQEKDSPKMTITHSTLTAAKWWVSLSWPNTKPDIPAPWQATQLFHKLKRDSRLLAGIAGIKDFYVQSVDIKEIDAKGNLVTTSRECIITLGSNLLAVCRRPEVDVRLTTTTEISEIYSVFGIDATMKAIEEMLTTIMTENDAPITGRYIKLIAAAMCVTGTPRAMTFAGLSAGKTSHLKLATFERCFDSFLSAGITGTADGLRGLSEAVLTGTRAMLGTNCGFQIRSDPELEHRTIRHPYTEKPTVLAQIPNTPNLDIFRTTKHNSRFSIKPDIGINYNNRRLNNHRTVTAAKRPLSSTKKRAPPPKKACLSPSVCPNIPSDVASETNNNRRQIHGFGPMFVPTSP